MSSVEEHGLPPEGLWISPDGEPVEVIEHLITIQQEPEKFGLSPRDVGRASIKNLRDIAIELIKVGWTRFRFLGGVWGFEVYQVKSKISLIEDVLVAQNAYPQERVLISQASPKRDYQGTVAEFYDRAMFRHYELGRRNNWRMS